MIINRQENVKSLKCHPQYFEAVKKGFKTFELRYNDRNFLRGDDIILLEYDPVENKYSGDVILLKGIEEVITHNDCPGIKLGYCVFSECENSFEIVKYDPNTIKIGEKFIDYHLGEVEISYVLTYLDFPDGLMTGYCIISYC